MDIKLSINGREVRVRDGATVMDAARQLGVYIPHFCYHPKLSIAANCRMCMVEVEKIPKPAPACATPAQDGMVVRTDSPAAQDAQRGVMEFLLINHPLDCPICDQGGECQLQDLAVGYGAARSRYREEKRVVLEKNLGPLVATDMTRCIHCTRCVRFGEELAGQMELGMVGRGEHAEIMPFVESTVDSEVSGNIIDICPVGALTSKPFRFSARAWELQRKPGIAAHDSWGSATTLHAKGAEVKRVVPRENESVNECWLSDRDRFSCEGLLTSDRALQPAARMEGGKTLTPATWPEAADFFAERLRRVIAKHGANQVGFLASPRATCEELFLLAKMARELGCENIDSRPTVRDFSGDDDSDGAKLSGLGTRIADIPNLRHALLIGANPARELPLLAMRLRKMSRKTRRRVVSAVGALDLSAQFKVTNSVVVRPSQIARTLLEIIAATAEFGGRENPVRNFRGEVSESSRAIAKRIAEAKGDGIVWLGASALAGDNRRALEKLALALAKVGGARVGILTEAANTIGAQVVGAVPVRSVRTKTGEGETKVDEGGTDSDSVERGNRRNETVGMNAGEMIAAKLKAYVLFNCEPADFAMRAELSDALREAEFVAALATHRGGVEHSARVVLPVASFAETDGTFVNIEGRAQSFAAAVPPPGEARPGWKTLRFLGDRMKLPGFQFETLEEVRGMFSLSDAGGPGGLAQTPSPTKSTTSSPEKPATPSPAKPTPELKSGRESESGTESVPESGRESESVPESDEFVSLDANDFVEGMKVAQLTLISETDGGSSPDAVSDSPELTFDLADGPPIYRTDMIVRRSEPLQKTRAGREADAAFFHPDDLQALGVVPGGNVVLSNNNGGAGGELELSAFADARLARGAVLAWPGFGGATKWSAVAASAARAAAV